MTKAQQLTDMARAEASAAAADKFASLKDKAGDVTAKALDKAGDLLDTLSDKAHAAAKGMK